MRSGFQSWRRWAFRRVRFRPPCFDPRRLSVPCSRSDRFSGKGDRSSGKPRAEFSAFLTGFVADEAQFDSLAPLQKLVRSQGGLNVTDPVMGDNGKLYSFFDGSFVSRMRSFLACSDLVTPNLTEAALLLGTDPASIPRDCGELRSGAPLAKLGPRLVAVTSAPVHGKPEFTAVACYDAESGSLRPLPPQVSPSLIPAPAICSPRVSRANCSTEFPSRQPCAALCFAGAPRRHFFVSPRLRPAFRGFAFYERRKRAAARDRTRPQRGVPQPVDARARGRDTPLRTARRACTA